VTAFQEKTLKENTHSCIILLFLILKNVLSGERKNSYASETHNAPSLLTADIFLESFLGIEKKFIFF